MQDWRPDLIRCETTEFSGLIAAEKLGIRHARFEIANGESEESIATNYANEFSPLRALVDLDPVRAGYLSSELSFSALPQTLDDTPRVNSQTPFRFRTALAPCRDGTTRPDWLPPNDKPLIYMTFGTIAADVAQANHVYRVGLEAVSDLPVNVPLTTGTNALPDFLAKIPSNVMVREFVAQAEILPHVQLLVCPGGSGTVLGGLAAGVPMVRTSLCGSARQRAVSCVNGPLFESRRYRNTINARSDIHRA